MTQAQVQQAELTMEELRAQADEAAELGPDYGEVIKGGGGRLVPEGWAMARLVSVVEYGLQPQEFNGQPKDPALEYKLGFLLFGQNPAGEKFGNEDGTGYYVETYALKQSNNEKAGSLLFFKQLNYKGTAKHPAQLLGQAFVLKIEHYKPKTDPNGKVRSRINLKQVLPPSNPVTGELYPIPPVTAADCTLFLWNKPTLQGWNKLYIDGTTETGESKNFRQEQIIGAVDFAGSPLEALLMSNGQPIPKARAKKSPAAPTAPVGAQPVGAVPPSTPAAPVTPAPAAAVAPAPAAAPVIPAAPVAAPAPQPTPAVVSAPVVVGTPALPDQGAALQAPSASVAGAVADAPFDGAIPAGTGVTA